MSPIACGGDRRGSTRFVVESKTVGRVRCSDPRCTGEKPVLFDTPTFLVYRGKSSATAPVFECDRCWRSSRIRMGRKSRDFLTQVFHWTKHVTNAGVTRRGRESCPGARLVGLVFQIRRGGARLIRWTRCASQGAHRRPCVAGVTPWALGQRCPGVGWQSQHIAFLGWFPSSCRKVSPVLARPSDAKQLKTDCDTSGEVSHCERTLVPSTLWWAAGPDGPAAGQWRKTDGERYRCVCTWGFICWRLERLTAY